VDLDDVIAERYTVWFAQQAALKVSVETAEEQDRDQESNPDFVGAGYQPTPTGTTLFMAGFGADGKARLFEAGHSTNGQPITGPNDTNITWNNVTNYRDTPTGPARDLTAGQAQQTAQQHPGRTIVAGADFNGAVKTHDYATIMASNDPATLDIRNCMRALEQHMHGPVTAGQAYANIDKGKLYLVVQDKEGAGGKLKIVEYNFVSGGRYANDPRYEAASNQGPAPANDPGDYDKVVFNRENFKGRFAAGDTAGAAYSVLSSSGQDVLKHGRFAIRIHAVGNSSRSTGLTAGCIGLPPEQMRHFRQTVDKQELKLVIGNTELATREAAAAPPARTAAATSSEAVPVSPSAEDAAVAKTRQAAELVKTAPQLPNLAGLRHEHQDATGTSHVAARQPGSNEPQHPPPG
jgi:hypothetical protein